MIWANTFQVLNWLFKVVSRKIYTKFHSFQFDLNAHHGWAWGSKLFSQPDIRKKVFQMRNSNPNNANYLVKILGCNIWFHHHCHDQPDSPGYYINSWPPNTPPRVESHCQLPSPLVYWSYRKKTTHAMYYKRGGVHRRTWKTGVSVAYRCYQSSSFFK